jgi:hypothetical protein
MSVEYHQVTHKNACSVSCVTSKPQRESLTIGLLSVIPTYLAKIERDKCDLEYPESVNESVYDPPNYYLHTKVFVFHARFIKSRISEEELIISFIMSVFRLHCPFSYFLSLQILNIIKFKLFVLINSHIRFHIINFIINKVMS